MIKSMTGVARVETRLVPSNGRIAVDIRSVNHKFFELVSALPPALAGHEGEIRELVRSRIRRGYVQIQIDLDESADTPSLAVNHGLARDYVRLARELQMQYRLPGTLDINTILSFPGLIVAKKSERSRRRLWYQCRRIITQALSQLNRMKSIEGVALVRDMRRRVRKIQAAVRQIEARVPKRLAERRQNFLSQLETLKVEVDPKRVLEEVAYIADKVDIHEECVRLKSHCSMFLRALRVSSTSGKKLDFIAQEMLRETDTMAAKARDVVVSRRAIEIKGEIEKLKEQVRNVE
ncbi:MAG: YicC/YloC family endoribonuclease [candidate division WOR-3 bacterium]